ETVASRAAQQLLVIDVGVAETTGHGHADLGPATAHFLGDGQNRHGLTLLPGSRSRGAAGYHRLNGDGSLDSGLDRVKSVLRNSRRDDGGPRDGEALGQPDGEQQVGGAEGEAPQDVREP